VAVGARRRFRTFSTAWGCPARRLWHTLLRRSREADCRTVAGGVYVLIAIGTAAIILWKALFPIWLRIATIYCYYLSYEYSVVSAATRLNPAAVQRRGDVSKRFEGRSSALLVALLANTNTHSLIMPP
jgi:hypothetical protein